MNKDVIYIEPEDDITDIILKIENSKEKIVALVPPKKAGVFRSVVNIKLIAKAGTTSEKSVVLVTVDPSITKLAAATKLPVAKNLQSAPTVPKLDNEDSDDSEKAELVEDKDGEVEAEDEKDEEDEKEIEEEEEEDKDDEKEDDDDEDEDEEDEEEEKPKKKDKKKSKKKSGGLKNWVKEHKKLSIAAGIALVGIIILLIWMLFIAPAVDISVSIKTDKKNFSENVTFVDKLEDENAEEGKFYLEQKKIEETQKVEFDATGTKNRGERAHGNIVVYRYFQFNSGGSTQVDAGTRFTNSGLTFTTDSAITLSYSGKGREGCENGSNSDELIDSGCRIAVRVNVTAIEPGEKYNIAMQPSGWDTVAPVGAYSDKAMEGGSDDIVTVVQQSDVVAAQNQIKSSKEEENKEKLFEKIKSESGDKYYIIDSSFEQTTSDDVVTPAVDEEVKEGVKPSLEVKTTSTVYVIDKVKLEEYVDEKAKLEDDQKVYDIKDIYIENMSHIAVGATTKLKAQYFVGPKLTSEELMGRIMGKGIGDARREIMDINGVSDVKIETSYPWVMAIPNDSNKVSVKFEIKDQDGNDIKPKDEENQSEDNEDEKNDEDKKDEKDDKKE